MGEDLVWVFGDTFVGDDTLLSATMARSSRNNPTVLREATDATGAPFPLYPASPQELAFDRAHASPPPCCKIQDGCPRGRLYCHCDPSTDCAARIALWPGDLIAYPDGRAVNFYEKVLVGTAFYDFTVLGTGLALIEPSSTTAFRYRDSGGEPLVLFGPGEPNFKTALRASDGSDTVYVFARVPVAGCAADVLLGRVHATKLHRREAYRFWNGCGWSEHLEDAEPVMAQVAGGMTSVAWNDHLGAYLAATGGLCTGGRELHLRAARRPEGPWGDPVVVDLSQVGADEDAYAARLHPDLALGSDLMVSYYQPAVVDDQVIGEVRLVTVPLAAGGQPSP